MCGESKKKIIVWGSLVGVTVGRRIGAVVGLLYAFRGRSLLGEHVGRQVQALQVMFDYGQLVEDEHEVHVQDVSEPGVRTGTVFRSVAATPPSTMHCLAPPSLPHLHTHHHRARLQNKTKRSTGPNKKAPQ